MKMMPDGGAFYLLRFRGASTENCVLEMLLNQLDAVGIGDFGMSGAVQPIQRINGGASLSVNTREGDQNIFAIKAAQHIVEQTDSIRRLNLNKGLGRMCFVIDGNARRKFNP